MTTTEAVDTTAITSDDIAAIKQADSVVLFWRPDGGEGDGIDSGMRLGVDVYLNTDPPGVAERRLAKVVASRLWTRTHASDSSIGFSRVIAAGIPPRITNYGEGTAVSAVWVDVSLRVSSVTMSVLRLLRAGDRFGVRFVGSNNNELLKQAGLHNDEVHLVIERKGKTVGQFLLDTQTSLNNSARMVQVRA